MTHKFFGMVLGLFIGFAFLSEAQAQRVELLFDEDQLLKGGRSALYSGNYERALFYYEEAVDRKDLSENQKVLVHNDLCVIYMYLSRYEEAVVQCKAALDLRSNRWQTYNNLGTVYLVMGDYDKAIEIFEKALGMKSKSEILKTNLKLAQNRKAMSSDPDKSNS